MRHDPELIRHILDHVTCGECQVRSEEIPASAVHFAQTLMLRHGMWSYVNPRRPWRCRCCRAVRRSFKYLPSAGFAATGSQEQPVLTHLRDSFAYGAITDAQLPDALLNATGRYAGSLGEFRNGHFSVLSQQFQYFQPFQQHPGGIRKVGLCALCVPENNRCRTCVAYIIKEMAFYLPT